MALTIQPVIDGVNCSWKLGGGILLVIRDITSSDVSVDYSSGFDIGSIKERMGLSKILMVLEATIRSSANVVRNLSMQWDHTNGKLKFLENAAAVGAFDEADPDTDIIDADIVRICMIGVGP